MANKTVVVATAIGLCLSVMLGACVPSTRTSVPLEIRESVVDMRDYPVYVSELPQEDEKDKGEQASQAGRTQNLAQNGDEHQEDTNTPVAEGGEGVASKPYKVLSHSDSGEQVGEETYEKLDRPKGYEEVDKSRTEKLSGSETLKSLIGANPEDPPVSTSHEMRVPKSNEMDASTSDKLPEQNVAQEQKASQWSSSPTHMLTMKEVALAGGWVISTKLEKCRLFLAQTEWAGGHRAVTRGCHTRELRAISAWIIKNKQLILRDSSGSLLAVLKPAVGGGLFGRITGTQEGISLSR